MARSGWTDDRVALVKTLWDEGLSAGAIADRLGGGITRNAVIGKVHRLGLHHQGRVVKRRRLKRVPSPQLPAPQKPAAQKPAKATPIGMWPRGPRLAPEPLEPAYEVYVPPSQRKGLLDLEANDCRWPIGDPRGPEFHFCGAERMPGQSYCPHHVARAQAGVVEVPAWKPAPPVARRVETPEPVEA